MLRTLFMTSLWFGLSLAIVPLVEAKDPPVQADVAPFPKATIRKIWVESIYSDGNHNGFPGIAQVGSYYYVAFRNSESHQAESAKIVVLRSKAEDLKHWQKVAEFTRDHDCRDPLVFDNHGKVQVVFHSKEDFYSQSVDGVHWTEPTELQTEFVIPTPASELTFRSQRRWLFRIRRGPDGFFYSLGRCGIKESGGRFGLILYRSADGVKFEALHTYGEGPTRGLELAGGKGWGHEADLAWTPDGTLIAAIRNGNPGVIVMGNAPHGPWKAMATDAWNFGGPALHTTRRGGILLAARALPEAETVGFPAVCKVWTITSEGVERPWILPSGGDCGYSSFADGPKADEVLLVYYSSHEYEQPKGVGFNPTKLYLAHLTIKHD